MRPPVRMLDDPNLPQDLRADLEVTVQASRSYDVDRGLLALHAALEVDAGRTDDAGEAQEPMEGGAADGGTGVESAALGHAKGLPWLLKATLVTLGGAGIFAAAIFGWRPLSAGPERSERPRSEAAAAPEAAIASDTPPRPTMERHDAGQEPVPDAGDPVSGKGLAQSQSAARRELLQLVRIKNLLTRDPRAAYRLARASQREFPDGGLRQEREGLTVLILERLARHGEAHAAARNFLARYPQSPLRERIQRVRDEAAAAAETQSAP